MTSQYRSILVYTRTIVTYIPDDNSARPPADTALNILAEGNVVKEELQEEVGLFLLVANNVASDCIAGMVSVYVHLQSRGWLMLTLRVHVEGFLASDLLHTRLVSYMP